MRPLGRREFCLGAAAALTLAGCESLDAVGGRGDMGTPLDLFGDQKHSCGASGQYDVGPTSLVATGSALVVGGGRFFVCRDALGVFAVSSVCTHEGCDVDFRAGNEDFLCPCHDSRYSYDGTVRVGPARADLPHLSVCLSGEGNLLVDPSVIVAKSERFDDDGD